MSLPPRKRDLQPLPVAVQNLDKLVKPRRKKKKVVHTQNPFVLKTKAVGPEKQQPDTLLDGFLILKQTKCELPHEVIKLKLF